MIQKKGIMIIFHPRNRKDGLDRMKNENENEGLNM